MKLIVETDHVGNVYHYKIVGKRRLTHNPYGPAILVKNTWTARKEWQINGKRHRIGGPAIEWLDGDYDYYLKGKRHRVDGPAIVRFDHNRLAPTRKDSIYWYINGNAYETETAYLKAVTHWLSYKDVTRDEIQHLIGKFKIVEW